MIKKNLSKSPIKNLNKLYLSMINNIKSLNILTTILFANNYIVIMAYNLE